jgi:L-iditol 2-dehydrogenase
MKAAVLTTKQNIEIVNKDMPTIGSEDVLVRVEYVGVCGSDLHFFQDGKIGTSQMFEPRILGHEAVGVITDVGDNVQNLSVGDSVVFEPGIPCGFCEYCQTGHYNVCPVAVKRFLGNPYTDGAFQEYMSYPYQYVYKLPDNIPKLRGVMIEPFSVGLHAVEKSGARYGQNAVVIGAGCIGIMTMLALKAHGINQIMIIDVIESRLKMAESFGGIVTIDASKEDPVNKVNEITNGKGVDLVYETAGSLKTQMQTVEYVSKLGVITFVGFNAGERVEIDISKLMRKEASITTVFRYANQHKKAIRELSNNPIELERIVTEVSNLDDIQNVLLNNIQNKQQIIKAVIRISDNVS